MSYNRGNGFRGSPVTSLLHVSGLMVPGFLAVLLGLLVTGCPKPVVISKPPPCPGFDRATILEYERLIRLEDQGRVSPRLDRLHEWMERTVVYCLAIDAFREDRT